MYYLDDPNAPRTSATVFHLDNGVVQTWFQVSFDRTAEADAHEVAGQSVVPFKIGDYLVYATAWAVAAAIADELAANGIEPVRS